MADIRTFRPPTVKNPKGLLAIIVLAVLFFGFWRTTGLFSDWLWFQEVGYERVFTVSLFAQMKAAAFFGIPYFLFFFLNLFIANRLAPQFQVHEGSDTIDVNPQGPGKMPLQLLILAVSLILGLLAALAGAGQWENLLL